MLMLLKKIVCLALIIVPSLAFLSCNNDSGSQPNQPNPLPEPPAATNPTPADGSINIENTIDLSWELPGGDNYYAYDLYLGTNPSPPKLESGLSDSNYSCIALDLSTKYYWKIVTRDISGQRTPGPIWSFTTSDGIMYAEGFEGSFPPKAWTGWGWSQGDQPYSGSFCAESVQDSDASNIFYTPWITNDATEPTYVLLKFYYKWISGGGYTNYFFVGIQYDNDDCENLFDTPTSVPEWTCFEMTLPKSSLTTKFRFFFNNYAGWYVNTAMVDDLLIQESKVPVNEIPRGLSKLR